MTTSLADFADRVPHTAGRTNRGQYRLSRSGLGGSHFIRLICFGIASRQGEVHMANSSGGNDSGGKISRRNFAEMCVGSAAARTAWLKGSSPLPGASATCMSNRPRGVDQNPIRRRGTGLRAIDIKRVSPGLTLFTPVFGDGTLYLIGLEGNIVHTWKMPYPPRSLWLLH